MLPTLSLINVEPAPTKRSPFVYDVYPVPPYLAVIAFPAQSPTVIVLPVSEKELLFNVSKLLPLSQVNESDEVISFRPV